MRKFINIITEMKRPLAKPRIGDKLSEFNADGEYKSHKELLGVALQVVANLSPAEVEAMKMMADAVSIKTDWLVKIALEKWGLISGYSRSGDNAHPYTKLGELVSKLVKP